MNTFQEALGPLYPELGSHLPDPDQYAESVIVRVLNTGPDALREQMLEYYGAERVRTVAQARGNRLDAPVYRVWKTRLQLPDRSPSVERIQRLAPLNAPLPSLDRPSVSRPAALLAGRGARSAG